MPLTEIQRNACQRIGLTEAAITQVENDTHWKFYQHTNGSDIKFEVKSGRGYSFFVWLHNPIDIGIYVNNNKASYQNMFREKLGNWKPERDDINCPDYDNRGRNPNTGHIGDWKTTISPDQFMEKIEDIKGMVECINDKLADEDIWTELDTYTRSNITIQKKKIKKSYNLIVFGAPGTGKSNYLNKLRSKKKRDVLNDDSEENYFSECQRVTFYPTYSYAQFVGSYKPVMKDVDKDGFDPDPTKNDVKTRKVIAYEFVPGPFLKILKDAIKNEDKNYLLIIEEINRANAAAVFGDVFQLLDRDEEGKSEYSITPSREMIEFLESKNDSGEDGVLESQAQELRIPSNLYIWATMNSADQGVFPLDTAFKRRWDFEYMSLDDNKSNDKCNVEVGEEIYCKWGELRKAINSLLLRNQVNEDKLLSSSFVRPEDNIIKLNRFKMKVLMYLWEDAARMCRRNVFEEGLGCFSDLISAWDNVKYSAEKEDGLNSVFRFDTSIKFERVKLENRTRETGSEGEKNKDNDESLESSREGAASSNGDKESDENGNEVGDSGEANTETPNDSVTRSQEGDNVVDADVEVSGSV